MYLWEVQPASADQTKWDVFKLLSTLPSPEAYPPPAQFGCPLVKS
jgi:hypothetical protein